MTPAERRFKQCVTALLAEGTYPGPRTVRDALGQKDGNTLNSRQCEWRDEVFEDFMKEYPKHPITLKRKRLRQ